jgi:hypothetical protein
MRLTAYLDGRAFFYDGRRIAPGETFEVDVSLPSGRQTALLLIQDQRAYPADFPTPVEIVMNNGGDVRTVERREGLRLISHQQARPRDRRLWHLEIAPDAMQPEQVRQLVDAAEVEADRKAGSWVTRWRDKRGA